MRVTGPGCAAEQWGAGLSKWPKIASGCLGFGAWQGDAQLADHQMDCLQSSPAQRCSNQASEPPGSPREVTQSRRRRALSRCCFLQRRQRERGLPSGSASVHSRLETCAARERAHIHPVDTDRRRARREPGKRTPAIGPGCCSAACQHTGRVGTRPDPVPPTLFAPLPVRPEWLLPARRGVITKQPPRPPALVGCFRPGGGSTQSSPPPPPPRPWPLCAV